MVMPSLEGTCELECPAQSGLVHKTSETIHKSHPTSRLDQLTQHPAPSLVADHSADENRFLCS
jgi:hypothetical protein